MPAFYIQEGKTRAYELTPSYLSLITTDPKTFEALSSYIMENRPRHYVFDSISNNFGTYRVTFKDNKNYPLSYELNISEARIFFEKLLPLLKSHVDFYDDVENLIRRLG
ncbi:hypothetical protein HYN59_09895 [Flavobacterium album]|uniref:Uncharacterized protein n=2 Tax=Flavobacterium album TaxID=2175091 RepID=A0A2S1QYA9_9FLAO|nr:hypothetical protein HYN59_09895 [Flavobacterium album]